ncbi:MAG: transposase [Nitrosomonas sp.]
MPIDRANHDDISHKRWYVGRPRITVELADIGVRVNHKRVGRPMRETGIKGVSRRQAL